MTFTVKGHGSECGLLETIADSCILELSLPIPKQMGAVDSDPKISFAVGNKSSHCPDRRRIRQRPLNQGKTEPIEADKSAFRSNPKIAIIRLADGIDRSTEETPVRCPFIVDILRYCSGRVQRANCVHKADALDDCQKTTT
jgi:hypothetical protein